MKIFAGEGGEFTWERLRRVFCILRFCYRPQGAWGACRRSCPPACGLLLYFAMAHTPGTLLEAMFRQRLSKPLARRHAAPIRRGGALRSEVKEEAAGRGTRTKQSTHPPDPPPKQAIKLSAYASKQCSAQHPTQAPPTVPRETQTPWRAKRLSHPPDVCPSSPSRRPPPPKPPQTTG